MHSIKLSYVISKFSQQAPITNTIIFHQTILLFQYALYLFYRKQTCLLSFSFENTFHFHIQQFSLPYIMKQDIIIYLFLPPLALILTTIFISFLPLLKFVDISAQLSQLNGSPPAIEYVILMLILYYCFVAVLAKDNQKVCQMKKKKMEMGISEQKKSKYGQDTEKELTKLYKIKQFQNLIKKEKQDPRNKQKNIESSEEKRKNLAINIFNQDSQEDSDHENQLLSCHQMATSKKMF